LRAITPDAYNGWAAPVDADRRAPSHPGQHSHIALLTTSNTDTNVVIQTSGLAKFGRFQIAHEISGRSNA
jgi:hypothetical protein